MFFDASGSAVLIDEEHQIVATNRAWDEFAHSNGVSKDYAFVGKSYLQPCLNAARSGDPHAIESVVALMGVASGDLSHAVTKPYPCHGPKQMLWFRMSVRSLRPAIPLMLIIHEPAQEPVVTKNPTRESTHHFPHNAPDNSGWMMYQV
jgi:hypothetical protein